MPAAQVVVPVVADRIGAEVVRRVGSANLPSATAIH